MPFKTWFKGRWERRMTAELEFHLTSLIDEHLRQGCSREEAERRAHRAFGSLELAKDECRDVRLASVVERVWRDVRLGCRVLRKAPGFTAAAVLTLALGIGANTAIYQLLDGIRLRSLPVSHPEELALVELADRTQRPGRQATGYPALSNPVWEALRAEQTAFSGVLAWANAAFRLDGADATSSARGLFVSGEFFQALGVEPLLGRVFAPADDRRGCGLPGAVLSYGFWQRRFAGDPNVIGQIVTLESRQVDIIGVTPAGFTGLEIGRSYDVAVPICTQPLLGDEKGWLDDGRVWWLTTMGRIPATGTVATASAQLEASSPALFRATLPPDYSVDDARDYLALTLRATPGGSGVSRLRARYGEPLLILIGLTGLVLLMACVNLANLMLARGSARAHELAVRLAIGASRAKLVQQLMIENGLLALAGAAGGVVLAAWLRHALVGLLGSDVFLELPLDSRLLAFVIFVTSLTCVAFGLLPAWRSARLSTADAVKTGGRGTVGSGRGSRLRQGLVVVQVGISLVLLFGALLFAGTLRNLLTVDPGFRTEGVMVARVDFSRLSVPAEQRATFTGDLLARIRQVPGVRSAAEVRHVPLGGTGTRLDVWREGANPDTKTRILVNAVSDGYLETMGIPLTRGRGISDDDSASAPRVAVVTPAFATRLNLDQDPVGNRFRATSPDVSFEIVGLVPDSKYFSLREDSQPLVFVSKAQLPDPRPFTDFMIHSTVPLRIISAAMRRAMTDASGLVTVEVRSFETMIGNGLQRERLMAALSGSFGLLALTIAAVGLYGLMSYLVVRRRNEIGVRIALGARQADILGLVLRHAATLVIAGVALGTAAAFASARWAQSLVFGMDPHDLRTVALASLMLAAAAAMASYVPARRAARLDPLAALREE